MQTVYKKFPLWNILNLVEKKTSRVAVEGIERSHELIEVFQGSQPLVIEVRITPTAGFHECPMQRIT